jgi:hypothetical protein
VIRKTIARALVCGAFLSAHLLSASTLDFSFSADIQMGIGAGTGFSGTGSYDNSQATGVGVEYVPLTSFDLTAFSETITLANVFEDGDAILDNGVLTSFKLGASTSPYFEFLFDEPSFYLGPADAGVFYDSLGFNGAVAPDLGSGTYQITSTVPEPAGVGLLGLACWAMARQLFRARRK